jgi:hypothetical protein
MRRIYFIGFLFFTGISGFAQTEKVVDWKSDIEFLKKELPLKHKNLFFQMTNSDYEGSLDNISSRLSLFSDFEIAVKLQQIIARAGDSHTSVGYAKLIDAEKVLPLLLYWFSDGIYVMQTTRDNEKLLGSRISKINDFGIQLIVDSLSTLITVDNQAIVKSNIPQMITSLQLLEFFGFSKSMVLKVEVQSAQGQTMISEIKSGKINRDNSISFKPDSIALCWQNQRAFFTDKYFENEAVYYLQYNKCNSKELEEKQGNQAIAASLPSFVDFENRVFDVIQKKAINKLIFDMRFNSGGSSIQGTEFISRLAGYSIAKEDKKLYVVIGRKTFSSAIINTMDFKQQTKAIFVGEETGGKPNHFGEVRNFQLPSSGIIINYSTKYFKRTNEDLNTIRPDVIIESSFLDFKKGIDPVYEWIKNNN